MSFISKNPANGEILGQYEELTDQQWLDKLTQAQTAFVAWRFKSLRERSDLLRALAEYLRAHSRSLGEVITKEMGKPIKGSIGEVEKSAWVCDYYAENGEKFLANELVATEAQESYVSFEPLGVILGVMPWNFPFWQVFRFAAPAIMAGNVVVVKHASNVPQSANLIEQVFNQVGFPVGVYQNLLVRSALVKDIINDQRVQGVALTGSEAAGSSVASLAAAAIKPSVLELGGSDPFIVLDDAEVDLSCQAAVASRLRNAGQACNAAKRFIVQSGIYEQFVLQLADYYRAQVMGDPLLETVEMGPLASEQILKDVIRQVDDSVALGAQVLLGGQPLSGSGYFYPPTILTEVKPGMPVYDQEVFGPVAAVIRVDSSEEAVRVANDTRYGLGASLWTKDLVLAKKLIPQLQVGNVFVNNMVQSDPRLPFGGVKKSGYGRELSVYGLKTFVNLKTVFIK